MVVEAAPGFDDDPSFSGVLEPLAVQALVAKLAVEALDVSVLPGAAWSDERRTDVLISQPAHDGTGGELGAIVAADELRFAVQLHESRERQDHILRSDPTGHLDRQALARVLVEDTKKLECRSVSQ